MDNVRSLSRSGSQRPSIELQSFTNITTPSAVAASSSSNNKANAYSPYQQQINDDIISLKSIEQQNYNSNKKKSNNNNNTNADEWRSWLLWWNTEDWWSVWIGLIFFGCIVGAVNHGIPQPEFLKWEHNPFSTFATIGNYGLIVIFVAMGLLLWLSMAAVRTPNWKQYPFGYIIVFFVALISKMLASNVHLNKASLGASIWAIIFGFVLRNAIDMLGKRLPGYLKVAQQTELYIAASLVLLCIDISVLRPLAPRALFVSWLDTPLLFMVIAWIGWRVLKIDRQTAIILSGATFICGSSAAIALGASMGVPHKSQMPIAIISIFTIPSIIALPYIAHRLEFSSAVSGAWFGGCVDSTGGVIASASIYGDKEAINTSAVVKMVQNVLIGPLSVLMAWAWSQYELYEQRKFEREEELLMQQSPPEQTQRNDNNKDDNGSSIDIAIATIALDNRQPTPPTSTSKNIKKRDKAHVLLWKRFPKFVIGFVLTAVLFNTTIGEDGDRRTAINDFCFYVSEWFSTLSFVSIGLGLQLNEMKQNIRNLGMLCTLYILAQTVDIAITGLLAWVAFTFM